ncbi:DUF4174 domain-containing protein [Aquimarina pacifica]|uniref:DUF4174 domain-containing protein n=1 Tax=Aquimarina pacifica TaxID=1296415 RepID=UPI000472A0F4|nr:DUF4174 domain-containing protein [Aquimarina pacifica]
MSIFKIRDEFYKIFNMTYYRIIVVKRIITISIFLCGTLSYNVSGQEIKKHQWKNRVILLLTDSFENKTFLQQKKELAKYKDDLKARKLLVYEVSPAQYTLMFNRKLCKTRPSFYDTYTNKTFSKIILIGLDGDIKMKSSSFTKAIDIFKTIDQMPMRRNELRTRDF